MLSGGTLEGIIENGNYALDDTVRYTAQLLKAFRDLQQLRLVHRDIKPTNVLVGTEGHLKLSDFGLARSLVAPAFLTASDSRIGSLLYMSARQRFAAEEVTPRDDFYSLCLVLYELAAQRKIHTRNVPLVDLRPATTTAALCRLIDYGMADRDDWRETFEELCNYINLEAECLSVSYTGSVLVPEQIIKLKIDSVVAQLEQASEAAPVGSTRGEYESGLLSEIIFEVSSAVDKCAGEFQHYGLYVGTGADFESRVVEVGVGFDESLESLFWSAGIGDWLDDPMFGYVTFEPVADGGWKIELAGGKRLEPNSSFYPDDMFDRVIDKLDSDARDFLRRIGRSLAIGVAIGALERIEELLKEAAEANLVEEC